MKSVTTVAQQVVSQQSHQVTEQPTPRPALNEEAVRHVNDIFRALQAAFPAWRSAFPDDAALKSAKASWVKGLMDAGIGDAKQIALGVRKARQSESDFFPSVGKFIAWCRPQPEDLGLPAVSDAYREAANHAGHPSRHRWSHAAVYEAGRRTGWFEVRTGGEYPPAVEKAFGEHYRAVCREVLAGANFNQPQADSTRLEHHTSGKQVMTEEAKAAGRQALAALKRNVGIVGEGE